MGYKHELINSDQVMRDDEYERTGKQVRVPEDELVSIVLDMIDEYAKLHPRERRNYPNPLASPIVTRVASGKTIQIPQQIIDKAVEIHKAATAKAMRAGGSGSGSKSRSGSMEGFNGHSDMSPAHTRLAKRERYAGTDPFILDADLRGQSITGHDGQIAGDAVHSDYPQRYKDFNYMMAGKLDHSDMGSDLNDRANPYGSNTHGRYDGAEQSRKESVGQSNYGQRSLAHSGGPASGSEDYMDSVSGVQSNISPESGSTLVYAALDEETEYEGSAPQYQTVDNRNPDYVLGDRNEFDQDPEYNCESCGHNDGYRGNYPYDASEHDHEYDDSESYDHVDDDYAPYDEDDYNDDDGENKDVVENYSNAADYNYALYVLLIVLLIILIMNYSQQNQ